VQREALEFSGELNWDGFRRLHDALYSCVEQDGVTDVELDLSRLTKVFPNGALPLLVLLDRYRLQGKVKIRISGADSHKYLVGYDYLAYLDSEYFSTARMQPQAVHPFETDTELNLLINKKIDQVLSQAKFAPGVMTAFEWFLNEIAGNVLVHSQSNRGWLQVVVHPKARHIAVAVADGGIGVPSSIRTAPSLEGRFASNASDSALIEVALRDGVTSKPDFGQGKGLTGTMAIVQANKGGRLAITSQRGRVFFSRFEGLKLTSHDPPFRGTLIDIQLDFSEPIEIEKALWGHSPVAFTELVYGKDAPVGIMRLMMKDQASSFGNRITAARIRLKIENLLNEAPTDALEINFDGVSMLASSFSDEVFGKLVVNLGIVGFSRRIKLFNLNPFCQGIIDDVVQARMAQAYAMKNAAK
jgi:ABC-type transporter Mla MlaB component